jgi:HD-like signal output (HDOD) protein
LSRDQFLERVERVFQTKTLSGVVVEVIAMASSPKGDTAQLAALISRDPMLSARVLQAANSALYASAGAVVTTIRDAIRKVGYTAVRNIAAALGVFGCMPDAGTDGFNPIRCWQHSFAVAQLCERLATEKFADQSGLAYLVGLCHDLGDIFIRTEFGKEYQQVIEMSAQSGRPKEQLHGQMLGMTTAQMISAVLKCMSLPDAIRKPIEMLHSPAGSQLTDPLARILWMGENYANAAMLASSPGSEVAPLTQSFCRAAVGQPNPSRPDPQTLRSQVLSLTVALARLSRAEESQLLAPMFKTQTAKLWIARDTGISEFDPVGLALESLSKVAVQNRLPTEKEIAEISGLVVVASSANTVGFSRRDIESALGKVRSAGRTLPVLAVSCSGASTENQAEEISWRASVTLAELAAFAEKLVKDTPAQAA